MSKEAGEKETSDTKEIVQKVMEKILSTPEVKLPPELATENLELKKRLIIVESQINDLKKDIQIINKNIADCNRFLHSPSHNPEIQRLETEHKQLLAYNSTLREQVNRFDSEIKEKRDEYQTYLEFLKEKQKVYQKNKEILSEKFKKQEEKAVDLGSLIKNNKQAIEETMVQLKEIEPFIEESEKNLESLNNQILQTEKTFDDYSTQNETLEKSKQGNSTQLQSIREKLSGLQSEISTLKIENQKIQELFENHNSQYQELIKLVNAKRVAEEKAKILNNQLAPLNDEYHESVEHLKKQEEKNKPIKKQLAEKKEENQLLTEELQKLRKAATNPYRFNHSNPSSNSNSTSATSVILSGGNKS